MLSDKVVPKVEIQILIGLHKKPEKQILFIYSNFLRFPPRQGGAISSSKTWM